MPVTPTPRRHSSRMPLLAGLLATVAVAATAIPAAPAAAGATTFKPVADSYAHAGAPRKTHGRASQLRIDAAPSARGYLRFDVEGLTRPVAKATLEVFARTRADRRGIELRRVSRRRGWREATLSHRNSPRVGRRVSRTGSFRRGRWISLDATALVAGNGAVSMAITTRSRAARRLASRTRSAHAPRLVVRQRAPGRLAPGGRGSANPSTHADRSTPAVHPTPTLAGQPPPPGSPGTPVGGPLPTTTWPSPELPPASGGATPDVPAEAPTQSRGVQLHPLWGGNSVADFDRELDLAKAAGVDTVRIDLSWSSLETNGKGRYSDWYVTKADTFLAHAEQRGIKVIATLWSTPCWASTAPEELKQSCTGSWWERDVAVYAPTDPTDYADAAEWVTRRWGDKLEALEVWNEPNLDFSLKAADPAATYAAILKAAYPRIKAADADLTVLGGAIAFSDGNFLTALYSHGIKGSYDAISYHPYNEWRDPDDLWKPEWQQYSYQLGTRWMREIMVAHGESAVGMWQTEVGFSSCTSGSSRWCVTEQQQAEYTADTFRIARERMPYVKAVVAYNLRGKGTDPADREAQFGLVNRDFTPKPAYAALALALKG